ncbi:MAG: transporter substrate-binding domain-containing protein [Clostridia bacterium]|nr:transporter substrate-binding domain-containing protein [Clostridia bacterium]
MKKFLSLILAAVMLCSAAMIFSSCGAKETFVIGITYFEPMNYFGDDGKLTGFETEFATAVCEKLGYEPEFIEIDWGTKETELNAGNIDCIWNGMTIDDERKANMGMSNPYMENKQVLVVKAENAEKFSTAEGLKGAAICAEAESAGETVAKTDAAFAGANYTGVSTMAYALMEVASGTSDGCVIDFVTSIGMIGEGTDYDDLVVVEAFEFAPEYYGIAFRKSEPETLEKFQKAIDELMADGTIAKIAEKYKLQDQLVK